MSTAAPIASLHVREHGGKVFYEALWRHSGEPVKRRVGAAWLERAADGSWRPRRGRIRDGFYDERRAHVAAAQLVTEHAAKVEARAEEESREPTFRDVAHAYLKWLEEVRHAKPSTLRDHRSTLAEPGQKVRRGSGTTNGRIMAAFGGKPATEVSTKDVEQMLARVAATGVGPRTVNKYREVMNAVFNFAMKPSTFGLAANPAAHTDKRRLPQRSALAYYASEDIEALARACEDSQDAELMRVAAFTGLRMGELLALRWGDVDFDGDALTVSRAMSASVETGTKSGQVRQVPLAGQAAEPLKRLRERGDFTSAKDLVFCNVWGRPLDGSALRRRFKVARDAAKLRDLRFHDLRHTYGSLLAAAGVDPVTIQAAMGHSSLTTTNRYLHARPASTAA